MVGAGDAGDHGGDDNDDDNDNDDDAGLYSEDDGQAHSCIQLFCTDLKGNVPKALLEKALRFGMESSIKTKMKEAKRRGYI